MSNASDFVIENGVLIKYNGNEKECFIPDGIQKIGPSAFNTFLGGSVNLRSVHIPKSVEEIDTYSFNTAYVDLYMNIHCPLWEVSGTAKMYGFAKSAICRSGSTINFLDDSGKIVAKVVLATKGETEPKENGAILSIRQENNKFDFAGYDANWANLGKKENKILVAMTRIQYPYELSDEMLTIYEDFLTKQGLAAGKMFIDEENYKALLFLAEKQLLSKTTMPKLVDYASQQGKTSATMILLAQQNKAEGNPALEKTKKKKSEEKILWKKPKTGTKLIGRYIGTETEIIFPEKVDGTIVEGIADTAGETPENYKNLVSVVIPEGYKIIGKKAFAGCENLEHIVLPGSLEEIKSGAFQECPKIREIYFSKNIKSFGTDSFYNSTIGTVVFENPNNYEIGGGIFKYCNINDFVACGGNFKSKGLVFKKYGYGDIFPERVWINGDFDCGEIRENGSLAKNVHPLCEFDETVIENASLREFVAKDKLRPDTRTNTSLIAETMEVESIDFRNSSFVVSGFDVEKEWDVRKLITNNGGTVKDSVSSKVQYLVIPDGDIVKTTKYKKAEELRSKGKDIAVINLSGLKKHIAIYNESVFGKDGAVWCSEFFMTPEGDEIRIDKYIGNKKSVSIPEKIGLFRVTALGKECFIMNSDIQHVAIPEGVGRIDEKAFLGCYNLKCVVLPESIVEIGNNAYNLCEKLKIHAPAGSYAETYAKENNIPFVAK